MRRILFAAFAVTASMFTVGAAASATDDSPCGSLYDFKVEPLDGKTFTVPTPPAGWTVEFVVLKVGGPDGGTHITFDPATAGQVLDVSYQQYEISHAHVCKSQVYDTTTTEPEETISTSTTTIVTPTTAPATTTITTVGQSSTTTDPAATTSTTAASTTTVSTSISTTTVSPTTSAPTTCPSGTPDLDPSCQPTTSAGPTTTATPTVTTPNLPSTGSNDAAAMTLIVGLGALVVGSVIVRLTRRTHVD